MGGWVVVVGLVGWLIGRLLVVVESGRVQGADVCAAVQLWWL